jgi:hypothetical protein
LRLRQPVHSPPNQKESHKTGAGRRIQTDSELTYNPLNPICKRKIQYIGAGFLVGIGCGWAGLASNGRIQGVGRGFAQNAAQAWSKKANERITPGSIDNA